jgi:hypothetical protein
VCVCVCVEMRTINGWREDVLRLAVRVNSMSPLEVLRAMFVAELSVTYNRWYVNRHHGAAYESACAHTY